MFRHTLGSPRLRRVGLPALLVAILVGVGLALLLPPTPRAILPGCGYDSCWKIFFSPDGRCLGTFHEGRDAGTLQRLRLWDAASGRLQSTLLEAPPGTQQLEWLAFAPNGRHVAARWFCKDIQVFERDSGREVAVHRRDKWPDWNPHLQIVYSPAGQLWLHGPEPATGKMWDVESGREVSCLPLEQPLDFYSGMEEGVLLAASKNRQFHVWQLQAPGPARTFTVPYGEMKNVRVAPGGRFVAGRLCSEAADQLLVLGKAGVVACLPMPQVAWCEALAPDADMLALSMPMPEAQGPRVLDWLLHFFGAAPAKANFRLDVLDLPGGALHARLHGAKAIRFASDGTTLAAVGEDGQVRLYDLPLRRPWPRILALSALVGASFALLLWLVGAGGRGHRGEQAAAAVTN